MKKKSFRIFSFIEMQSTSEIIHCIIHVHRPNLSSENLFNLHALLFLRLLIKRGRETEKKWPSEQNKQTAKPTRRWSLKTRIELNETKVKVKEEKRKKWDKVVADGSIDRKMKIETKVVGRISEVEMEKYFVIRNRVENDFFLKFRVNISQFFCCFTLNPLHHPSMSVHRRLSKSERFRLISKAKKFDLEVF